MRLTLLFTFALASACAQPAPPQLPSSAPASGDEAILAAVAAIHGGAGPWAVAGYRMGAHALRRLELPRGSLELEVLHGSPQRVQYTCVADGAAAATGASLGKLNLALVEASEAEARTTYRRRSDGAAVTLRLTPAFVARFSDVPRSELARAGREVLSLADAEIFEDADNVVQ